jgi:hypothetical protein
VIPFAHKEILGEDVFDEIRRNISFGAQK